MVQHASHVLVVPNVAIILGLGQDDYSAFLKLDDTGQPSVIPPPPQLLRPQGILSLPGPDTD